MQSVIMAGGQGSRLRPLTCDIPKPLTKLCGRPVIEYILDLLDKHGFEKATMTLMYLGEKIVSHFDGKDYKNVELEYSFEPKPLGTAGSVKNALKSINDDFLVISGDAMCDFDLTKAINFHKDNNSIATLIVKKVEDPREYGLVNIEDNGRISGFLEKPSLAHCTTDLANTGIYILSPNVLEYIAEDKSVDFASDVFPSLLKQNLPIYAYQEQGYWCDIGDLNTYIKCQRDMLEQKVVCDLKVAKNGGIYSNHDYRSPEYTINPPVYIGNNVKISPGCIIDSGTVICDNVTIDSGCKIKDSILLDGAYISQGARCVNALIGVGARLGKNSCVFESCVLGSGAVLGDSSIVPDGLKVWNKKTVPPNVTLKENLQYGLSTDVVCDEDGICGETNISITPELSAKIGSSIASLIKGSIIAVGCNSTPAAKGLKHSLISGIVSSGSDCWDLGCSFESQFNFCLTKSQADFGVYIHSDGNCKIKLSSKGAMPILRPLERKLERCINNSEYNRVTNDNFGQLVDLKSLKEMYMIELIKSTCIDLKGMSVQVKTSNPEIRKLLEKSLIKLGCNLNGELCLHVSSDGKMLSVYSDSVGYIYNDRILTLLCIDEFENGHDISIPASAPKIIDDIAKDYPDIIVHRYYECPCDDSDKQARKIASENYFVKDGLIKSIKLLSMLKRRKLTFEKAISLIPKFDTANRYVKLPVNPLKVIKQLAKNNTATDEGVIISYKGGDILIRPSKAGKGIMMYVQSFSSESADEICDFVENAVLVNPDNIKF